MKKLSMYLKMAFLAFTLLMSNAVFAQKGAASDTSKMERRGKMADRERPSSDEMVAKLTEKMQKDLSLTDEQTAKVLEINKTFASSRQSSNGDKKAMKEATKLRFESLKSVLTKEQIKKFKEDKGEAMDKMRERRGRGDKPNKGDK